MTPARRRQDVLADEWTAITERQHVGRINLVSFALHSVFFADGPRGHGRSLFSGAASSDSRRQSLAFASSGNGEVSVE